MALSKMDDPLSKLDKFPILIAYYADMKGILTCLMMLVFVSSYAQKTKIDSLLSALQSSDELEQRSQVLTEITYHYLYSDLEQAALYGDSLLLLSKSITNPRLKAKKIYVACLPLIYSFTEENMTKALPQLEQGLAITNLNDLIDVELEYRTMLGVVYGYFGDTENAMKQYDRIISNPTAVKDSSVLSAAYSNLGRLFQEGNENDSARRCYQKAVKINRDIDHKDFLAVSLSNLASVTDDIDSSKLFLKEAVEIAKNFNLGAFRLLTFNNEYGDLLSKEGRDLETALQAYRSALKSSRLVSDQTGESTALGGIARIYNELSRPDSAVYYLEQAIFIDSTIQNNYNLRNNLNAFAQALAQLKKYNKAYFALNKAKEISAQLYDSEKASALALNAVKFETLEKEARLAQQELTIVKAKRQRNIVLSIGSILLFFLVGGFYLYRYRQALKQRSIEDALSYEKKEREQLEALDKQKMQFFTNVSHELKTPLTLILGRLSQIKNRSNQNGVDENIQIAYNNAERLQQLIKETLDFRKLENGAVSVNPTPVHIANDLRRMFYSFSSLAETKKIELKEGISFGEELVLAVDINKLEKIVNNLLSNAIKFSNAESEVVLMTNYKDGNLNISVEDYGKGIALEEQQKIFDRFYQVNSSDSSYLGGTGVGLAYAAELAKLMGGKIRLDSELNKGSRFTLSLPCKLAQIAGADSFNEEEVFEYMPILVNGQKPDILIVEDNKEMQDYLLDILANDYRCHLAVDGYDAIKKVQKQKFDLICSDVMMPNMDGFKLKEKLNEMDHLQGIPFVFLTARSLEEDKLEGLRLGTDDYLTKPFNANELRARIHNLLSNYKQRVDATEVGELVHNDSVDIQILKEAERIVIKHLAEPEFKVTDLANELHYSQRQLSRIIQKLTGLTPVNFILELRLQRAHHLINTRAFNTLIEVKDQVGIESASYFSRKFKQRFGISPSAIQK